MQVEQLFERGLPGFVAEELASRGITTLEPLLEDAVNAGLFEGRNLVVMAPTSSGKTLVAELAAACHATHRSGSVMVTSLKALAYEKYLTFRESYSRPDRLHFHTSIATEDGATDETAADHVALTVATCEKWYYTLVERESAQSFDKRRSLLLLHAAMVPSHAPSLWIDAAATGMTARSRETASRQQQGDPGRPSDSIPTDGASVYTDLYIPNVRVG